MGWLALVIAVLGAIYLANHYPRFRRGLGYSALGLLALVGVVIVGFLIRDQDLEKRRRAAQALIKPQQIELSQAVLSVGTPYPSEMNAIVTNKSPYHLAHLAIRVTVTDCPPSAFPLDTSTLTLPISKGLVFNAPDASKCAIVGENVAHSYSMDVPSGQKRALRIYPSFPNLPQLKKGEWSWHYSIELVTAKY